MMSRPPTVEDKWNAARCSFSSSVMAQHQWRLTCSATGIQRQRLQKVVMNPGIDGGVMRSRAWINAYELSQDLHAKQVEILEKKYGGAWRSRHAAVIIQRAYRHYCLTRSFAKLRWEADEKRLSRRFAEFSHSKTIWSDLAATIVNEEESGRRPDTIYSEYDNIMTHSYSSDNMLHHFMAQKTSRTFRQTTLRPGEVLSNATKVMNSSGKTDSSEEYVEIPVQRSTDGVSSYIGGHGQLELGLSDSGESVLSSPLEPSVDLPSACFESLLERQVADILDDSFTSDSCDDGDTTPVNESTNSDTCHDYHPTTAHPAERSTPSQTVEQGKSSVTHIAGTNGTKEEDPIPVCGGGGGGGTNNKYPSPTRCSHDTSVAKVPNDTDTGQETDELSPDGSPVWKRKSRNLEGLISDEISLHPDTPRPGRRSTVKNRSAGRLDVIESCAETSLDSTGPRTLTTDRVTTSSLTSSLPSAESLDQPPFTGRSRKRAYRIGLNLFNKKPENGVRYLIMRRFLDQRPNAVAKFLISRKGLSKQMIGEYLGNLQKPFNMEVLRCFANEIELSGLDLDVALRKFQSYFRMPGEAQKIERLMEAFATRYCQCNPDHVERFLSSEAVFLLAFAIIMLNTDLHNSNIKPDRKMKVTDFVRNLRGIDGGQDIDSGLLAGVYERIRACELKPGADHVSHVFRLEQMIFGNKPQLSLPHRRLVCYCRMYEVIDPLKRDKVGQHQRELFLFNDVLMITKLFNKKKKKTPLYSFRQMFSLFGMVVHIFESPFYKYGLRLSTNMAGNILILLNARNEHDRTKFVDDLKESILEITEMEGLRIEEELKKQKICPASANFVRYSKDSGVVDVEMLKLAESTINRLSAPECEQLKKSPLSSSLVDISDKNRRGSGVSLDSGVASAESESVGSCQEPNRSSRFLGLPVIPSGTSSVPGS